MRTVDGRLVGQTCFNIKAGGARESHDPLLPVHDGANVAMEGGDPQLCRCCLVHFGSNWLVFLVKSLLESLETSHLGDPLINGSPCSGPLATSSFGVSSIRKHW